MPALDKVQLLNREVATIGIAEANIDSKQYHCRKLWRSVANQQI